MSDQSILIIGAGIAGLSAGCYAQMNGYRTQIFESHSKPGGLCTSWKRQEYTFDGCIHWLVGSGTGSGLHRVWEELGASQGRQIVDHEEFSRYEGPGGKCFIVYTNADRLEQHMKELAPADSRAIEELCNALRGFARFDIPLDTPKGLLGGIKMFFKMLPFIRAMKKYGKISIQDFAARFADPFLREAFAASFDVGEPDFPAAWIFMNLAWMHNRDAGYPIGGSLEFSRAIERRYLDLGGEICYKSPVEKVLVENNRAVGVRLTDGTEHRADIVVSAADGRTTIFDMLEGNYVNADIRGYYDGWRVYQPLIQVSLGVARDMSDEPHSVIYPLEEPVTVGGELQTRVSFKHYCYDPSMAPSGRSVVVALLPSSYEYWKSLLDKSGGYEGEKESVADVVISQLEKRVPGLARQIEAVDVATPLTYERFTGNWQGSYQGWMDTTETVGMMLSGGMSKTLPGLANFYMVGQWVYPGGGLPGAALSGRGGVQLICEEDDRPFVTQVP